MRIREGWEGIVLGSIMLALGLTLIVGLRYLLG